MVGALTADALLDIITGHDTTGFIEVRCLRPGRRPVQRWFPLEDRRACLGFIARMAPRYDVYVGTAPRVRRAGGKAAIKRWWCLWADVDSPEALERLEAFKPSPSLVVRSGSGSNCHAYWALDTPLSLPWFKRANDRLISAVGGDLKVMDAARILRPPGTLNHKHSPPSEVTASAFSGSRMSVVSVAKNLPDPRSKPHKVRLPRRDVLAVDPLLGVSADRYYTTLTGRPISHGNVQCPFHGDGAERNPSMRLYDGGTWYCFGCCRGGGIFQFAAALWDMSTSGAEFMELRERLARELT